MKVEFSTLVKNLPSNIKQEVGKAGSTVISLAYKAVKKADLYQAPDTFKLASKETAVGAGVFGIATVAAIACIKGIVNKIKETRNK